MSICLNDQEAEELLNRPNVSLPFQFVIAGDASEELIEAASSFSNFLRLVSAITPGQTTGVILASDGQKDEMLGEALDAGLPLISERAVLSFVEKTMAEQEEGQTTELLDNDDIDEAKKASHDDDDVDKTLALSPADDFADPSAQAVSRKVQKCKYGPKCYRKNRDHLLAYWHPSDNDAPVVDDAPVVEGPKIVISSSSSTIHPSVPSSSSSSSSHSSSNTNPDRQMVKRCDDHYYCTCPAWRMQNAPVDRRSCKHIKSLLGDEFEEQRCGENALNPPRPSRKRDDASASNSSQQTRRKKKRKTGDKGEEEEEEEEEEDNDLSSSPRRRRSPRRSPGPPRSPMRFQPSVLLAQAWKEGSVDPRGFHMSEKLDGVRAWWTGERFLSRNGNPFDAPEWFTSALPSDTHLDGELFGGREKFQQAVSIVRSAQDSRWSQLTYQVFDVPQLDAPFEERIAEVKRIVEDASVSHLQLVSHEICKGTEHLKQELSRIEALGGEGLMLRQAKSRYVGSRSSTLLKVKSMRDAEAEIIGHEGGSGRHEGRLGSFRCKLLNGKMFNVGSGLSDAERDRPLKIGSIITFKYQNLTNDGIPRFPTFLRERTDGQRRDPN